LPLSPVGLVAPILLVLATLPALAYASPPDPSWIPGLYDDADYDDVVVLVTSATGNIGPDPLFDLRPIMLVVGRAPADPGEVEYSRPASIALARAPPVA
jgi:hypothetical protein